MLRDDVRDRYRYTRFGVYRDNDEDGLANQMAVRTRDTLLHAKTFATNLRHPGGDCQLVVLFCVRSVIYLRPCDDGDDTRLAQRVVR